MQNLEDMFAVGLVDTNFCLRSVETWMELKYIPAREFPKRPTTKVKLKVSDEQYIWLHKRTRAGGRAFLLVQVVNEVLLLPADTQDAPYTELLELAVAVGREEVLEFLTTGE